MRALQLLDDKRLELTEIAPPPAPGNGEVTVQIKAVALNHIDVWGWRGMAFAKRKLPLTIGAEASGIVQSIGSGVGNLQVGQIVSIYGARTCGLCKNCREGRDNLCTHVSGVHGFHIDGFACEAVNLPARLLVPAPLDCDEIDAAVAPITFGTVEHMLFDNAKLQPGETILIHAGGSGIGSAAIQLAKRMGCTVYTTVGSDGKIEKAKALGADVVINYRNDRFEHVVRKLTKKKGVDVVFEHVGADTWAGSMLSLKRGGRLVTCGSTSGVSTSMNLMQLFQQQLKIFGSFGCRMENMANAMQKMAEGIVHPVVDTIVDFGDIEKALKRMESRDVFGKIILKIS
ncbi:MULTISPECIES: zinc-binding dehydrogenase [Bartonella]|uniref:zinc-binding dehydrogenase n=1 Tax=Bartonella TaxID=773 RepID=UPI0018DCBB38|nr:MULTISPECIES: zinc-binding dehydrogenase [Bartonella]MBH9994518.1 zinc-binding dehydrogenase [Bartonella sp. P0291]MBH9997137.1 zinc-binding dehydrogenase [Bartonella sp. M0192]MBH9999297.1 zinc-binding dehydrogenase [Bartonella sp. M0191]MBI0007221.1 zinc-binding dehydrogenase [Bartonella sp. M0193]MBI0010588.1 zinc-binding dehydrogenase [Bartonella sp. M0176]